MDATDRSRSCPDMNTATLASKVAVAFMSGNVDAFTAAWLNSLFPASQLVSLSVLAGSRLLISAENLLQPGYFKVSFSKIDETVAGRALTTNKPFYAQMPAERHSPFTDLHRTHEQQGSGSLVAVPISERQRRVSLDQPLYQPPDCAFESARRSSASDDTKDGPRRSSAARWNRHRGPPVGALSMALPRACPLTSMHLQNLTDLAEALSPQIARYCSDMMADMTSVFCSPPQSMVSDDSDASSLADSFVDATEEALTPEELVDRLLCGGAIATAQKHTVDSAVASRQCVDLLTPKDVLPCA